MSDSLGSLFRSYLQPASFNDVEFGVLSADYNTGRRLAIHDFPLIDDIYVEDLGRGIRKIRFVGWLCGTYDESVFDQRDELLAVLEEGGTGILVHPSLGSFPANLVSASFAEDVMKGNYIGLNMEFVLSSENVASTIAPFDDVDTGEDVDDSADELDDSASDDYETDTDNLPTSASSYVESAITDTVQGFADLVTPFASDAASVINAVQGINFVFDSAYSLGRFVQGNIEAVPDAISYLVNSGLPVNDLLSTATTVMLTADCVARQSVLTAASEAVTGVSAGSLAVPAAVQALTESLRSVASPADGVRLISNLCSYAPMTINSTGPIGSAIQTCTNTVAAACRRAALSSLGRACGHYQPTSANDSATLIASVLPLFDAEILSASAANDSASLASLRRLKVAVIRDQQAKALGLPNVVTLNLPQSIPLLRLAMQYFGDATQANNILLRNPQIACSLFSGTSVEILNE